VNGRKTLNLVEWGDMIRNPRSGSGGVYVSCPLISNKAVGLDETPDGYVWHHVEDGRTMQLIPASIHAARHTGGAAVIKNGGIDKKQ
jgi:hypothetical protein